jgi:hypothetical protein
VYRLACRANNNYYAFHELMKREFINTGGELTSWYWFPTPDNSAKWYAPRIAFLRKWLDDLNNN